MTTASSGCSKPDTLYELIFRQTVGVDMGILVELVGSVVLVLVFAVGVLTIARAVMGKGRSYNGEE